VLLWWITLQSIIYLNNVFFIFLIFDMLKIEIHDFFLSSTERYVFLGHVDKKNNNHDWSFLW
jgi:hypothetical protein